MVKEQFMSDINKNLPKGGVIQVRRGTIDSITVYDVTDDELKILKSGEPANTNFAVFVAALGIAISCILTLVATEKFKNVLYQTVVFFLLFLSIAIGLYSFFRWIKGKNEINKLIEKIKSRLPIETEKKEDYDAVTPTITMKFLMGIWQNNWQGNNPGNEILEINGDGAYAVRGVVWFKIEDFEYDHTNFEIRFTKVAIRAGDERRLKNILSLKDKDNLVGTQEHNIYNTTYGITYTRLSS